MTPVEIDIERWRRELPPKPRAAAVFLLWQKRPKVGKPGKFDKVPFYANGYQRSGEQGGTEDRRQLASLETVLQVYASAHWASGIGMALLPDVPVWALDLDHCVDPATGEMSELAVRVVGSGSYVETSPSGTGLRALYAGKIGVDAKNLKAGVETFNSQMYVTLTGNRISEGRDITRCPSELQSAILEIVRPRVEVAEQVTEAVPLRTTPLPGWLADKLANPYPNGRGGRAIIAYKLALALKHAGVSEEEALRLMCEPKPLEPAMDRRGSTEGARKWMAKYVVIPAYRGKAKSLGVESAPRTA